MPFDLALLKYQLSQMSGPELAQELKELHTGLPIIMISGCAVLPPVELLFVNAHFGAGTSLDNLIATMKLLLLPAFASIIPRAEARPHGPVGGLDVTISSTSRKAMAKQSDECSRHSSSRTSNDNAQFLLPEI